MLDSGAIRSLSRRSALIGVGVISLCIVSGCATFGRSSEIDALISELDALVNSMDAEDNDALRFAANSVSRYARELVDKHAEFASEFNSRAQRRGESRESLQALVDEHESGRVALRNELLRADEALFATLPAGAKGDVLALMNRRSRALAPRRGQET